MELHQTLSSFDQYLAKRALRFDAIIAGGAALVLLGVIQRATRDVDVLAPMLPEPIARAASAFAADQRVAGVDLAEEWLNNGPVHLTEVLPRGWRTRVVPAFRGSALELNALARSDLLNTKLFALCDRGIDLQDCLALAPSVREIARALPWLMRQDGNELWPTHVQSTLAELSKRLGHAV